MAGGLSHKDTILIWNDAVLAVDKGPQYYETALQTLMQIENPAAKILFDIGHVNLATGHLQGAEEAFRTCTEKDPHLAIGLFQLGLCYYRQARYADSKTAYEKAITCLRGNKFIDYKQLGMVYKLYECEVQHNMALTYSKMMSTPDIAIQVLEVAVKGKVEAKHNAIGTAITKLKQGDTFDPFTIPAGIVFRPSQSKVANVKNIDYLGKAKIVSELTVPDTPAFLYVSYNVRLEKVRLRKKWKQSVVTAGRSRSPSPAVHPNKSLPAPPNAFRPISPYRPTESPPLRSPPLGPPSPGGSGLVKLKDSLVIWNEGVVEYDKKNYTGALDSFLKIEEPSAKILFNMASLQVRLGQTDAATNTLQLAIAKDQHLAIAHSLLGNLYCKVNRADDAWRQYEKCLECFRSNKSIDYKQLGMSFKLCQCEVLYNQAYTYAKLGEVDWCTKLLEDAQRCKLEEKHSFIDTAIDNYKKGTLFNILDLPVNLVFRPPKDKVANLKKQDYLGKQKVVSELKPATPPPIERKPPASPLPQLTHSIHDGELYLPMAPGPLTKENTYHEPPRPPKPKSSSLPSAPVRTTSLTSQGSAGDRSPSPGVPGRLPPQVPIPILERQDSFDSDSFDSDHFEDDYRSKPVPVPLTRRFSASNPLPPVPGPQTPPDSLGAPRRPPPSRPVPSPVPNSSPSRGSPVPPYRPVPSPTRGSPVPQDRPVPQPPILSNSQNSDRTRKTSLGVPPSKPVPVISPRNSPRSSPVPQRPEPNQRIPSPINSPARQRKISSGPPSKPVPPSPHRKSPGVPERKPPAPPPSLSNLPPAPPSPLPDREVPLPPSNPIPKPTPAGRSLPLRPARPLTNGNTSQKPVAFSRRLSTTHVVAVVPFQGEDDDMLSFGTGELIQVYAEVDEHWLEGELRGCQGIFPRQNVKEMSLPEMTE